MNFNLQAERNNLFAQNQTLSSITTANDWLRYYGERDDQENLEYWQKIKSQYIRQYREQLQQNLTNLLGNAIVIGENIGLLRLSREDEAEALLEMEQNAVATKYAQN